MVQVDTQQTCVNMHISTLHAIKLAVESIESRVCQGLKNNAQSTRHATLQETVQSDLCWN